MSLEQRAHLNLLAFLRLSAELTPGARIDDDGQALLCFANNPTPFFNVVATRDGVANPQALLDRAEAFFADAGSFVVHTREGHAGEEPLQAAAEARGYMLYPHYPNMIVPGALAEPQVPPGCELTRVEDPAEARVYWNLCNEAYPSIGFPPGSFDAVPDALAYDKRVHAFIARVEGEPAACALGFVAEGCTFIGWVAALEKARRRGLGAACTVRAVNAGVANGAQFASLQASEMGESVYKRLGFEQIYNYRLWIKLPAAT